jgi:hypothetical protein
LVIRIRRTCAAIHRPPRAVGIPQAFIAAVT